MGVLMEIFVSGCSCGCSEVIFANNHVCSSVHMIWPTYVAPGTETMNLRGVMTEGKYNYLCVRAIGEVVRRS